MQHKIDTLKATCASARQKDTAVHDLDTQEAALKASLVKANTELANLPPESLAAPPGKEDKQPLDRTISRMVTARNDIATKLDILPGIRARCRAQAEGLRKQVHVEAQSLVAHCLDLAAARVEKEQGEIEGHLSAYHAGHPHRARAAAAHVMRGASGGFSVAVTEPCNSWKWREAFAHYSHAADPLEDADTVIRLAEAFARGEPRN